MARGVPGVPRDPWVLVDRQHLGRKYGETSQAITRELIWPNSINKKLSENEIETDWSLLPLGSVCH